MLDPNAIFPTDEEENPSPFLAALSEDIEEQERVEASGSSPSTHTTTARADRTAVMSAVVGSEDLTGDTADVLASLEGAINANREAIRRNGEVEYRYRAAATQQRRETEGLIDLVQTGLEPEFDPTGEVQQGASLALALRLNESHTERVDTALEEEYANQLADLAVHDPVAAYLAASDEDYGDAIDTMVDNQWREMVIMREIENAGIAVEDRDWYWYIVDLVHRAIPLIESTAQTDNVEGVQEGILDFFIPGKRARREAHAFTDRSIPREQLVTHVQGVIQNVQRSATDLGYFNQSQYVDILANLQRGRSEVETNAWALADNAALPWGVAKFIFNVPARLTRMGARQLGADITAASIRKAQQEGADAVLPGLGIPINAGAAPSASTRKTLLGSTSHTPIREAASGSIEDLASLSLPRIINTTPALPVGNVGVVANAFRRGQGLLDEVFGKLPATSRQTPEDVEAALEAALERINTTTNRDVLLDVSTGSSRGANTGFVDSTRLSTGSEVRSIEVTIGTKSGDAFASRGQAERYARSMGLELDETQFVPDIGKSVFIRLSENVGDTGALALKHLDSPLPNNPFSGILRHVASTRNILDEGLMGAALRAGNRKNVLLGVLQGMAKPLRALKKGERADLETIMQLGRDGFTAGVSRGEWFNRQQFIQNYQRQFNRIPGDREWEAYSAARNINDVEYALRNDQLYADLFSRNFESISIPGLTGARNARVMEAGSRLDDTPIFNSVDEVMVTSDDATKALDQGTHVVVAFADDLDINTVGKIRRVLVPRASMQRAPLDRIQLPYRAGGHRMYQGQYFAKQAHLGDGVGYSPRTFIVGRTKQEVQDWADVMNRAIRARVDDGADAAALDDILKGRGFPSGKELIDDISAGRIDPEHPIRSLFDRDIPMEYTASGLRNYDSLVDDVSGGIVDLHKTRGQMFYSRRGERLRDFNGDLAPTLNVYQTIDDSIKNISAIAGFSDFKAQSINRWLSTYQNHISKFRLDTPPARIFHDAKVITSDTVIREQAEAQREAIQRILNWQDPAAFRSDRLIRSFGEWLGDGQAVGSMRRNASSFIADHGQNITPVSWLRSMAFDLKLGMFNIAQFPLQISTILASTSIDPGNGLKGMMAIPLMRKFLMTNVDDIEAAMEGMISRGIHKQLGIEDATEFRAYMMEARQGGFLNVSAGATGYLDNEYAGIGSALGDIQQAGRIPFVEAEIWNRIVARHIGWQRLRKDMPDLNVDSPEFLDRLAVVQDDFALNMQRESQAAWQQGLLGIPTQFFSYQARMMEMMFGNRVTQVERARLILGQMFFYGSAGVPAGSMISGALDDANDGAPGELNTWRGFFDRGAIDHLIFNTTGADVLAGSRMAVGDFAETIFRDVFNMSKYGDTSFFDVAAGATGGISYQTGSDLMDVMTLIGSEALAGGDDNRPLTNRAVQRLFSNISTFSNGLKGYTAFQYGTYVSNSGSTLVEGLDPAEAAFIALFSYQPGEMNEISSRLAWAANRTEAVDELAKYRGQLLTRFMSEPDNREDISEELRALITLATPAELRADVIEQSQRYVSSSLLQNVRQRQPLVAQRDRAIRENN